MAGNASRAETSSSPFFREKDGVVEKKASSKEPLFRCFEEKWLRRDGSAEQNVFATAWIAFAVARASNRPSTHIPRAVSTSAAYVSELARRSSRPRSPRSPRASAPASPPPSRVSRAIFTSAAATCTRSSDARRVTLPELFEQPDATVAESSRARTRTSSSRELELSERRTFSSPASRVIISFA